MESSLMSFEAVYTPFLPMTQATIDMIYITMDLFWVF